VKSFYVAEVAASDHLGRRGQTHPAGRADGSASMAGHTSRPASAAAAPCPARIAMYDGAAAAPRVEEVAADSTVLLINQLSTRVYESARAMGGSVPYSVVREVAENFIHADFREPVVSVLDRGNTIRFSDQGPGFSDAERAVQPGYTTATHEMKQFIRGVGSGLPLVREYLAFAGGSLVIEGNLDRGAVVTVSVPRGPSPASAGNPARTAPVPGAVPAPSVGRSAGTPPQASLLQADVPAAPAVPPDSILPAHRLTNRQKQVLALVMDIGAAGPSIVAKELSVGLSTAYRDLARLESLGLIVADEAGKREITAEGTAYLDGLLNGLF